MPPKQENDPSLADEQAAPAISTDTRLGTDPRKLKILIISTPKTGNTWLKYLLSDVYDLPIVNVEPKIRREDLIGFGERWVGHQHLFPSEQLLAMLRELDVRIITTVRHPADVLVSYFHYTKALAAQGQNYEGSPEALLLADDEKPGVNTLRYVREAFSGILLYSAAWLPFNPILVRYEDLKDNPVRELFRITKTLAVTADVAVERAVALCELSIMRGRIPELAYHFRKGESQFSHREDLLPTDITAVLANEPLFREINRRLGYSFDKPPKIRRFDYSLVNPFHGNSVFSNGVPAASKLIDIYLKLSPELRRRWPDPANASKPDSFFAYLTGPVDLHVPVITGLADSLYKIRPDLMSAYPDYRGRDRWPFVSWFIYTGNADYKFDPVFIKPVIEFILTLDKDPFARTTPTKNKDPQYITSFSVNDAAGQHCTRFNSGEWILVTIELTAPHAMDRTVIGLRVLDGSAREFFGTTTRSPQGAPFHLEIGQQHRVTLLLQVNLPPGGYRFDVEVLQESTEEPVLLARTSGIGQLEVTGERSWSGLAHCHAKVIL